MRYFHHYHRKHAHASTPQQPTLKITPVEGTHMAEPSKTFLDDLRGIAAKIDPSLQLVSNEVGPVLSAFLYHTQYGEDLVKAADTGADEVSKLLSPAPPAEAPTDAEGQGQAPASGATANEVNELRAQLQHLQQQIATSQQTQVEHEPGAPE